MGGGHHPGPDTNLVGPVMGTGGKIPVHRVASMQQDQDMDPNREVLVMDTGGKIPDHREDSDHQGRDQDRNVVPPCLRDGTPGEDPEDNSELFFYANFY